jgi:hypothetical protein
MEEFEILHEDLNSKDILNKIFDSPQNQYQDYWEDYQVAHLYTYFTIFEAFLFEYPEVPVLTGLDLDY